MKLWTTWRKQQVLALIFRIIYFEKKNLFIYYKYGPRAVFETFFVISSGYFVQMFLTSFWDSLNIFKFKNNETKFCQIQTDFSQFLTLRHMLDSQAFFSYSLRNLFTVHHFQVMQCWPPRPLTSLRQPPRTLTKDSLTSLWLQNPPNPYPWFRSTIRTKTEI